MVAVVAVLLTAYIGWLLLLLLGIYRQDEDVHQPQIPSSATILIAFRNEEAALPQLLSSLADTSPAFPILALDDHSIDASAAIVQGFQARYPKRVQYQASTGLPGKRTAIAAALPGVAADWILQTDADCVSGPGWAVQALSAAEQKHGDMCILPLRFRSQSLSPFWLSVINTEFASVMAVTSGMARWGRPVMCNGANLAYRKSLWMAAAPYLARQTHAGGDDMFLLDYAVTHGARVVYTDAPGVWVETEAPSTLGAFFAQRRRWAAKWTAYRSPWPYAVGGVSLLGQGAFVLAPWLLVFGQGGPILALALLGKVFAEGLLLRRQLQKGGMAFHLGAFLFWQVFYLPYVLASALPSLWTRPPAQWKN